MRILIADDDEMSRKLLRATLSKQGHEITEFVDGTDVRGELFRGRLPQLLILDWLMPGLSGPELCKLIRNRPDLPFTYIILITGKSESQDVIEGLRSGANDYITKPFTSEELQSRIQVAIQMIDLANLVAKQRTSMIAASKMTTLGEMAAGVAHEINNPLAIIMGNAERMDLNRDTAMLVHRTAGRIAKIVTALITFSNQSENDSAVEIPVAGFIDELLLLCRERFQFGGIDLRIQTPSPDLIAFGQKSQIAQAVFNLLENAFLAVGESREKWISLEVADDSKNVLISIVDSGPGIPEEFRTKIMQPFFTTRKVGKGAGLGLSVAKGIIETNGGTLTLDESSLRTRFVIEIPKLTKTKGDHVGN